MYCVIQEVDLKKPNKHGYPKEIKAYFMDMFINGKDFSHYAYIFSCDRFERPIKKAYKISLHQSYRENRKIKKKQYPLCTVGYYEIADKWFGLYDYCNRKIEAVANELGTDSDMIYGLIDTKLNPLIEVIQNEFSQTEEFITHADHEIITTLYAINKIKFAEINEYEQALRSAYNTSIRELASIREANIYKVTDTNLSNLERYLDSK